MGRKRAVGPVKTSKATGGDGRERPIFQIPEKEVVMQGWINEVGEELRDVERQIRFFREYVASTIHGREVSRRPAS